MQVVAFGAESSLLKDTINHNGRRVGIIAELPG